MIWGKALLKSYTLIYSIAYIEFWVLELLVKYSDVEIWTLRLLCPKSLLEIIT